MSFYKICFILLNCDDSSCGRQSGAFVVLTQETTESLLPMLLNCRERLENRSCMTTALPASGRRAYGNASVKKQ